MCFVNTYINNIVFFCSHFKPDVMPGNNPELTISALVVFVLSLASATYLIFFENRKQKRISEIPSFQTITGTEDEPKISLDKTKMSSDEPKVSSDKTKISPDEPKISSDETKISSDETMMSSDETMMSSDETPSPSISTLSSSENDISPSDNMTSNAETLQSVFDTVSLSTDHVSRVAGSVSFASEPAASPHEPLTPRPRAIPLRPKPVPSRPKPIPIEPPPAYYISNLQVEPSKAIPGDTIFVSFTIISNIAIIANFPFSLKVNNFEIYSNKITLNPYESKSLSYPIRAIEPGEWDIYVNNTLCKLSIIDDNR